MNKNYKYYYTTPQSQPRGPINIPEYENEYNEDYASEGYYEEDNNYKQTRYMERSTADQPKPKIEPTAADPNQSVPKVPTKLPYCIVPVLYVPKRVVHKEEIARNRILQNSLASLSRMENLFYKYKSNYDKDTTKLAPKDVDATLVNKQNAQDYYAGPKAYSDDYNYDSQYDYYNSDPNYPSEDEYYATNYQKPQFQEFAKNNYLNKSLSVLQNGQASVPNYNYMYNYNYEKQVEPPAVTFANHRATPYVDTTYYVKQPNDVHLYTRDDWLTSQGRRLQNNYSIASGTSGSCSRHLKNSHTNTTPKLSSVHSIGITAIVAHDSKVSQTSAPMPGYVDKRTIFCEISTQTEPQNYIATITHRLRSSARNKEPRSDFCEGSSEMVQAHPSRSATLIPKLKPILTSCNTDDPSKPCIHERNSYDSRQRSNCQKPLRSVSPEAARKFWK